MRQKDLVSEHTLNSGCVPDWFLNTKPGGELKDEGFFQLKKIKAVCVWLIGGNSLFFPAYLGFEERTINPVCPALMFYSVSCGLSEACSIIRGRFQRRHVGNDAIPRKRALCCLF